MRHCAATLLLLWRRVDASGELSFEYMAELFDPATIQVQWDLGS